MLYIRNWGFEISKISLTLNYLIKSLVKFLHNALLQSTQFLQFHIEFYRIAEHCIQSLLFVNTGNLPAQCITLVTRHYHFILHAAYENFCKE